MLRAKRLILHDFLTAGAMEQEFSLMLYREKDDNNGMGLPGGLYYYHLFVASTYGEVNALLLRPLFSFLKSEA